MIFNCWLQILRAKPINALIAFSLCLSRVRSEKQCIVGVLCPGVQSDCWLPFPEALLVRGRRSGAIQTQTVVPLLHFHIPSCDSFHTILYPAHTHSSSKLRSKSFMFEEGGEDERETRNRGLKKKPGVGKRGWNRDEGRGNKEPLLQ